MLSFLRPRPWRGSPLAAWLPGHKTSLEALYVTEALRNFGLSLVGVFVPVYIYQLTGNFFWLPAYLIVFSLSVLLFTFPFATVLRRIGIFDSVFLSNVIRLVFLGSLLYAPQFLPLLFFAAVLEGLLIPSYWVPYHFIYSKEGKIGAFGRQIGLMGILATIVAFPAPLLGGLIISQFGFTVLYLLGMAIVLLSSFPLAWGKDHLGVESFSPGKVVLGMFAKEYRPIFLGLAALRVEAVVGGFLIFPIFVYLVANSFTALGGITSALTLVWLLTTGPIGALVDRLGPRKSLWIGAGTTAGFWGVVGFAASIPAVFALALARSVFAPFLGITPDAVIYTLAQSRKVFEFILQREFSLHFGGLLAAVVIAILWFFFPANWPVLFSVGVVGALGSVLLSYTKSK